MNKTDKTGVFGGITPPPVGERPRQQQTTLSVWETQYPCGLQPIHIQTDMGPRVLFSNFLNKREGKGGGCVCVYTKNRMDSGFAAQTGMSVNVFLFKGTQHAH